MDFAWTDEQKQLHDGAVKFAGERLCDGVIQRDKDHLFSRELWQACADFGLQGLNTPEELGGGGHAPLEIVTILEGVGRGGRDNGLVFSVGAHLWACTVPLVKFGTAEQKARWLPGMASGELIAANGMTEPDTGSDAYALRTSAQKDGDAWVLNGQKTFVTNAPVADLFVVYARTGDKPGFAGITCFIIEKGTPGLTVGKPMEKMGLRTSPMAELFFDDCRVPGENLLGREGSGSMVFNMSMDFERLFIMAPALGAGRRLLERCVAHAKERKTGETPLGKHQSVAHTLVEMDLRLEQAGLALYQAAWIKGKRGVAMAESARAKLAVSHAYEQTCRDAVHLFGGYGYMVEYELERELRDATAATLYSGTSEVQRNIVAALKGL